MTKKEAIREIIKARGVSKATKKEAITLLCGGYDPPKVVGAIRQIDNGLHLLYVMKLQLDDRFSQRGGNGIVRQASGSGHFSQKR